jgi:hypothetical protein
MDSDYDTLEKRYRDDLKVYEDNVAKVIQIICDSLSPTALALIQTELRDEDGVAAWARIKEEGKPSSTDDASDAWSSLNTLTWTTQYVTIAHYKEEFEKRIARIARYPGEMTLTPLALVSLLLKSIDGHHVLFQHVLRDLKRLKTDGTIHTVDDYFVRMSQVEMSDAGGNVWEFRKAHIQAYTDHARYAAKIERDRAKVAGRAHSVMAADPIDVFLAQIKAGSDAAIPPSFAPHASTGVAPAVAAAVEADMTAVTGAPKRKSYCNLCNGSHRAVNCPHATVCTICNWRRAKSVQKCNGRHHNERAAQLQDCDDEERGADPDSATAVASVAHSDLLKSMENLTMALLTMSENLTMSDGSVSDGGN